MRNNHNNINQVSSTGDRIVPSLGRFSLRSRFERGNWWWIYLSRSSVSMYGHIHPVNLYLPWWQCGQQEKQKNNYGLIECVCVYVCVCAFTQRRPEVEREVSVSLTHDRQSGMSNVSCLFVRDVLWFLSTSARLAVCVLAAHGPH